MRNFFALLFVLCVTSVFADDKKPETLPKTAKFADGTEVAIPYPDVTWEKWITLCVVKRGGVYNGLVIVQDTLLEKDDILLAKCEMFVDKPSERAFTFIRDCTAVNEPLMFLWAWPDETDKETRHYCVAVRNDDGTVVAVNEPFSCEWVEEGIGRDVRLKWLVVVKKNAAERVFPR